MPAKAGIQGNRGKFRAALDPRFRGGDEYTIEIAFVLPERTPR
jgi:hypothetical protein